MRVLMITPTSKQVISFRAKLISAMRQRGIDVSVITFDGENRKTIEERGIDLHVLSDSNRSTNPFRVLTLKRRIKKLIKAISPDVVMTFMLKPNIYGTLAARAAGVKRVYCMVEGAGDVFINNGFKWKLIRAYVCHMYKKAFKRANNVIFLNNDDKAEFVKKGLVDSQKTRIVHGIGIDLNKFAHAPVTNHNTFLMVARMLRTKGIMEYCAAARAVRQKYPQATFNYLGGEGTVKVADMQPYIDDGSINYLGTTNNVVPVYEGCGALVLPSYREGFPVSVMEAQAVGRLAIVNDTNGCRDAVKDGYSGFIIDAKNVQTLANKMIWCLENPQEVERMGNNARAYAEENFDENSINDGLIVMVTGGGE